MMNRFLWAAAKCVAAVSVCCASEVEVSPDGAVKTPADALDEVRSLRAAGKIPTDRAAIISFAPGRYELGEPLDVSGKVAPVVFKGATKGVTCFSGGRTLGPFVPGKDGIWRCPVPAGFVFEQLWVNGTRVGWAKSPNEGYHYIFEKGGEEVDPETGKEVYLGGRVFYSDTKSLACLGKIPADEMADVAIHIWWSWNTEWFRLQEVDVKRGRVRLKKGVTWDFFTWKEWCPRFTIENCRAALDAPGEWYLDRKNSELLYIPRPGETPETTTAVAPALSRLAYVHDTDGVSFERIAFEHNGWMGIGEKGVYESQSAHVTDAAILVKDASHVDFRNCRIRHTADYGLWFSEGVRDSGIWHSMLDDLGAGGIRVGARQWTTNTPSEKVVRNVTIDDNIIHAGGYVFPAGTGVFMTYVRDCTVTHNDIFDFYYSGICCGWTWGYAPTPNRDNEISWNHVHHLGKGVLSDMGFIYTLGDNTGTRIVGNHGHDIFSYDYTGSGGEGLYPDEGSRGILWASNLIHHAKSAALSIHYGKDNRVFNNIFAYSAMTNWSVAGRFRPQEHLQVACSNNVFVFRPGGKAWLGSLSGRTATVKDIAFGSNLWWSPGPIATNAFNGTTWEQWRASGMDAGSVIAEPLFRDWQNGDWRLDPKSPAFGIGFHEWDYTFAGVRKEDPSWRMKAEMLGHTSYPSVPVPPKNPGARKLRTGFETRLPGEYPRGLFVDDFDVPRKGYVQVSSQQARSGQQSLEIRDDGERRPARDPKIFQRFNIRSEKFVLKFSLLCDERACLVCNWCACKPLEKKGPEAFRIEVKDGRFVLTADREIVIDNYAVNNWNDLAFTVHAPKGGRPTFDFSLTNVKGVSRMVRGLRFRSADCPLPTWIGFESCATWDTKAYIDDYSYESK